MEHEPSCPFSQLWNGGEFEATCTCGEIRRIAQLEADKRELWEALKKARGIADPAHAFTIRHITLPMIDAVLAKHKEAK